MGSVDMKTAHLLWQAITPVHVGTGQDGSGIIDLPVAREASTNYPILPASGLKGVIRDETAAGSASDQAMIRLFGDASSAGDLIFHDARVLAVPVPSMWGTFALVTCPLVLARLKRDLSLQGFDVAGLSVPSVDAETAVAPQTSVLLGNQGTVLIDDFIVPAAKQDLARLISYLASSNGDLERNLQRHLLVLPDDVFAFLVRFRLPITPHVRIDDETGTVAPGALWYEEVIPEETLLASFVAGATSDPSKVLGDMSLLQVGGHRSVGRGLVQLHVRASLDDSQGGKGR